MKIFNIKRKKASLEISMNAIVILVLAIAILGLGLTFIRGIFKGITAKVEEAVSAGEIVNPPTRDRPVTITPPSVELRQGENSETKIAFMNIQPSQKCYSLGLTGTVQADGCVSQTACRCDFTATSPCKVAMVFSNDDYSMQKDAINMWTVTVNPKVDLLGATDPASKTYLYTATFTEVTCGTTTPVLNGAKYSRDFVVKVSK